MPARDAAWVGIRMISRGVLRSKIGAPAIIALAVLSLHAPGVLAWGEEGHRMVGAIAERYLTPEARAGVLALLKHDRLADGQPSGRQTLGEIAYWADEIRDTTWGRRSSRWHYDDIPLCGDADRSRYCAKGACATAQLARHIAILANRVAPLHRRNEALKWTVHLIGDIHQPLHAANHRDRGGNQVEVSFFRKRANPPYGTLNLHAIWDVHLVRRQIRARGGEESIVMAALPKAQQADWERGSIDEWIAESHQLARSVVYPALPAAFSCDARIEGVLTLGQAYFAKAAPVIELQITKAGVRLAGVLNQVFEQQETSHDSARPAK